jgi:hypothetical protein
MASSAGRLSNVISKDERVVPACDIGQKSCRTFRRQPLLNGDAFLHDGQSLTSFPNFNWNTLRTTILSSSFLGNSATLPRERSR